jgi:hypothetical protein
MKKIIFITFLLVSIVSLGQKKKAVSKPPTFKITYDKFENTYTYNAEAGSFGIYANGTNKDYTGITYKYLTLTVYDSYLTHASGIILLFSDGTKMNIDTKEELGDSNGKGMWRYYVMVALTDDQWLELTDKIIISYKFHIFERNYKYGNQFKTLVNNFYE